MKPLLTRVIEKRGRWYIAYVKEIPGVNTQGRTRAEARHNLEEAFSLIIQANQQLRSNRL
jgi:predicted RNase H-like HicB family nuclease